MCHRVFLFLSFQRFKILRLDRRLGSGVKLKDIEKEKKKKKKKKRSENGSYARGETRRSRETIREEGEGTWPLPSRVRKAAPVREPVTFSLGRLIKFPGRQKVEGNSRIDCPGRLIDVF